MGTSIQKLLSGIIIDNDDQIITDIFDSADHITIIDNADQRQCQRSAATLALKTGSGTSVRPRLVFATLSLCS